MSDSGEETIAQKQKRLESLLDWFESDDFQAEQVGEKFEEAKRLSEEIEKLLLETKNTITQLKHTFENES